jgi:coenzyme F420-reducing hydrogenase alpha subunit
MSGDRPSPKRRRTIKVSQLARVEGEGALKIAISGDKVTDVQLKIFEPPRFFEALLRGRRMEEAPDITARICGICPVAYQMSAVHAIEDACGVQVTGPLRELRRMLYCGEWIESHTLHIHMLHAPDFLGYEDAIRMAKDHPEVVKRGLAIKKVGNAIVTLLGGREIHPINVKVGGFYRVPTLSQMRGILDDLKRTRDLAAEAVKFTATLPFPEFEPEHEYVSLKHPDEYPFCEGRIASTHGLDIGVREYDEHFQEIHVKHSTALHAKLRDRGRYFVGPMARYNLNFDLLSPLAKEAALETGLGKTCHNPFKSIIVRAVETLWALDEAVRIAEDYTLPDAPAFDVPPRSGVGHGCTEAPRGLLHHRYEIDDEGTIRDAQIVPPTSQNQSTIEQDLRELVPAHVNLSDADLQWRCEQSIRNYDPCISCSTHFLKMTVERTPSTEAQS